jgi:hypothetical protein
VKEWKKIFQENEPQKPAGVAILLSDKTDFKPKLVRGNKECHFITTRKTVHHYEIIFNIYTQNIGKINFKHY